MKQLNGYANAKAPSSKYIQPGVYKCKILGVKEETGNWEDGTAYDRIAMQVDVAEGDFTDYFLNDYKSQTPEAGKDKFFKGMYRMDIPQETDKDYEKKLGRFKQQIEYIEAQNSGYTWDWNEQTLKGKYCYVAFGYVHNTKTNKWYLNARRIVKDVEDDYFTQDYSSTGAVRDTSSKKKKGTDAEKVDGYMHSTAGLADELPFN